MLVDNSKHRFCVLVDVESSLIALNFQSLDILGPVRAVHTSVHENMFDGRSTGTASTESAIRTAGVLIENQIFICGFSANYAFLFQGLPLLSTCSNYTRTSGR